MRFQHSNVICWRPKFMHKLICCLVTSLGWAVLAFAIVARGQAQVATPTISPNGQTNGVPPQVTLSCVTSGSIIRYTTNGTDPSTSDPQYSSPFIVVGSATVKAKAWVGSTASSTASAVFSVTAFVAAGGDFAFSVRFDGIPQSWGNNSVGQLGRSVSGGSAVPAGINVTSGAGILSQVAMISGSDSGAIALLNDGSVRTWGANTGRQLGTGNTDNTVTKAFTVQPKNINNAEPSGITMVAAGASHKLALIGSGVGSALWGWGSNGSCQLAQVSDTTNQEYAVKVKADSNGNNLTGATAIAAGASHSMALKSDGTVWVWGDNSYYQFFNNQNNTKQYPGQKAGISNVKYIASGGNHCLAIDQSRTLYAWGRDDFGQCGVTSSVPISTPTSTGLSNVAMVAGGLFHTVALKNDGTVWSWGRNLEGQLGDGTTTSHTAPSPVKISSNTPLTGIAYIACGNYFSVALAFDGTVYVWGKNSVGQLALTGTTPPPTALYAVGGSVATNIPKQSNQPPTVSMTVAPTSASLPETANFSFSAMASDPEGNGIAKIDFYVDDVFSASDTTSPYNFTINNLTQRNTAYRVRAQAIDANGLAGTPFEIPAMVTYETIDISAAVGIDEGQSSSSAFNISRPAPMAGSINKQLTVNYSINASSTATYGSDYTIEYPVGTSLPQNGSLNFPAGATSISLKVNALTDRLIEGATTGGVETVVMNLNSGGYNFAGGTAFFNIKDVPPVASPSFYPPSGSKTKLRTIWLDDSDAGASIYYTMTTDGSTPSDPTTSSPVLVTGKHVLKLGSNTKLKALAVRSGLPNSDIVSASYSGNSSVVAMTAHSFAVLDDGTLWAWGENGNGGLGTGDYFRKVLPVKVAGVTDVLCLSGYEDKVGSTIQQGLRGGGSFLVKSDGGLMGTGRAKYSYGDGLTFTGATWLNVPGVAGIAEVSASSTHTLLLKQDGTALSWGDNTMGELARSVSGSSELLPSAVKFSDATTVSNIRTICAGDGFTVLLRNDGTVWICGKFNGITTLNLQQVTTLSGIVAISAGAGHILTLKDTGAVYGWGDNASGQLGVSSPTNAAAPILTPFSNILGISAGNAYSLAWNKDGKLLATGINNAGQLGNGTNTTAFTPIMNASLTNISLVSAGDAHTSSLRDTGSTSVWDWGSNYAQQVGDGLAVDRLTSFQLAFTVSDADGDGIPDQWEITNFGNTNQTATGDYDNDGISNIMEYQLGRNPIKGVVTDTSAVVSLKVFTILE